MNVTSAPHRPPYCDYESETCSIARTLALVGDRWTLLVLRDVANGVRRFDELVDHLGIARNVLARRLSGLVDDGLVVRTAYRDAGSRERREYRLSTAGREFMPILLAIMTWGDRHLAGPEGPPALATHDGCGGAMRVSLSCENGHELGDRPRIRIVPGPGGRRREPFEPGGAAESGDIGGAGEIGETGEIGEIGEARARR